MSICLICCLYELIIQTLTEIQNNVMLYYDIYTLYEILITQMRLHFVNNFAST